LPSLVHEIKAQSLLVRKNRHEQLHLALFAGLHHQVLLLAELLLRCLTPTVPFLVLFPWRLGLLLFFFPLPLLLFLNLFLLDFCKEKAQKY